MYYSSLFSGLEDPRSRLGQRYRLESLLGLIVVGFLCGSNSLKAVWRFGHRLRKPQRVALGFDSGTMPSHPLLTTLLQRLDAGALEAHLKQIVLSTGETEGGELQVVAIDGKTLRGSRSGDQAALHMLSAFSEQLGGVLDQEAMGDGENEVGAAMRLLKRLKLKNTVITGDAMFAHQGLCQLIRSKGGHYLFALKDNHKPQREAVEQALDIASLKKTLLSNV